ncbi:aldehyde dehydrogenase family protein [Paenibacillus psychroresistens]|uniref:Aldehyde dehydrogenase family protein n=1 Tax=Paenibacillus psychroresistens TaxID=1778678 RepID=A0A6B8RNS8_9BACL|nr:aldehyde dehydrogenase family protein [Paenibacillus psychroresistens]QGQ97679.1 aldehyde dehydrogenase family protein [Paenibacillus psychroresistens]
MRNIDQIYINGKFVKPNGTEILDLINPATKEIIGRVTLGDEKDTRDAIAAAKEAFKTFSKTTKKERLQMLQRLHDVIVEKSEILNQAAVEEYGAPVAATAARTQYAAKNFLHNMEILQEYQFEKFIGKAKVVLEPLGVIGLITPWNANYTHISTKLAPAIAAGCTVVIKASELSAIQTQLITECFHEAGIPAGVINFVNGRGDVVGAELTRHPDVAMISFTGSSQVGRIIGRDAANTMKRLVLELGGKSPNVILDDADFNKAIPLSVMTAFSNSGQACHVGSRLIVPEHRLQEVKNLVKKTIEGIKVGSPLESGTYIGPMVSQKQYETVQRYIKLGTEEGAELLVGGEGHPEGLEHGYFVKPTVFVNVTMDMTIAKEEIFGPVLSILTFKTEEEAIEIANDTIYGLSAYVSSSDLEKANRVASQIVSGRVLINGLHDEPKAPFGGFKQSGIGREFGAYGLEEYVETKTILGFDVTQ